MRYVFFVATLVLVGHFVVWIGGCVSPIPTDLPEPPAFSLGDIVSVGDNIKVGIVIDHQRNYNHDYDEWCWMYSVMFQSDTFDYDEDKLELIEAFDWGRPAKKGVID
jgi:hypothetical protein